MIKRRLKKFNIRWEKTRAFELINIIGNCLVLAAIAAYFILPMIWMWVSAFRHNPTFKVEFKNFTTRNFYVIFFKKQTATWIRNSLIIASGVALIVIFTAILAAYPMARLEFKGKFVLHILMILSMTIPLSSVLVPTYSLIRALGLENTLYGVILVIAGRQMPMAVWVLKEFVDSIPRELEEAAWIDGCGRVETIFRIVLPLSKPGIAVVGLTSFVGGWGDFLVPLIVIASAKLKPISLGLYDACCSARAWGYVVIDYGLLAAVSVIYSLVPMVVYFILGKYLVRGMVIGALKR